jgi:hypothetical protein
MIDSFRFARHPRQNVVDPRNASVNPKGLVRYASRISKRLTKPSSIRNT